MIYTCTLNPSVDYVVDVEDFQLGTINKIEDEQYFPGGKGINVSRVLRNVEVDSVALGFLGGFTGNFIKDCLTKENITHDFIEHEEPTRVNVKLKTTKETEINGYGATIAEEHQQALIKKLEKLTDKDYLVLAGSIPRSIPLDFYMNLAESCFNKNIPFIVDVSGTALREVLKYKPFLIKPNQHELGELVGATITTKEDAAHYGKQLLELGAKNVIVSLGGNGAVFLSKEIIAYATVPKGEVKNSVGAGDSTVAGFLASYVTEGDVLESFKYGVAAGSATAFSADLCHKAKIESLISEIKIEKME
jgi:1-phosphofructokinase